VALRADIGVDLCLCRSRLIRVAACASYGRRRVDGMDIGFHFQLSG
jgi:hypothetical protein